MHDKVEGTLLRPLKLFAKYKVYYGSKGKYCWHYKWWFKCDCGRKVVKRKHSVGKTKHQTKSCGQCDYRQQRLKEIANLPQVKKNRFTSSQESGNKRQVGAKVGHRSVKKGTTCIYRYPNKKMENSERIYLKEDVLNDIFAGYKEINWEKRIIQETEIIN